MQCPVFGLIVVCRTLHCAPLNTGKRTADAEKKARPRSGRRVVIIEDQQMFAEFLSVYCRELRLEVVAVCNTGATGWAALRDKRPDLLLLDFSLPDAGGLEIARLMLAEIPHLKILGISAHRDPYTMLQVQRLGLHGFIDKQDQRPEMLTNAIRLVLSGQICYSPVVGAASRSLRHDPRAFHRILSDYEIRILALIGASKTDEELAVDLKISAITAQSRRRDIMGKLNIHSTPKLIHFAITNGLTRPEQLIKPV